MTIGGEDHVTYQSRAAGIIANAWLLRLGNLGGGLYNRMECEIIPWASGSSEEDNLPIVSTFGNLDTLVGKDDESTICFFDQSGGIEHIYGNLAGKCGTRTP